MLTACLSGLHQPRMTASQVVLKLPKSLISSLAADAQSHFTGCPVSAADRAASSSGCPVQQDAEHAARINMDVVSNAPTTSQSEQLETSRQRSSIPLAGGPLPQHQDQTSEDVWMYPSPQQFYNAMKRKARSSRGHLITLCFCSKEFFPLQYSSRAGTTAV